MLQFWQYAVVWVVGGKLRLWFGERLWEVVGLRGEMLGDLRWILVAIGGN